MTWAPVYLAEAFGEEVPPGIASVLPALIEREDKIADFLRTSALQLGLRPELVADVIATSGLGTEPSPQERAVIRANAIAYINELRNQQ